jgi:hypothetical protein
VCLPFSIGEANIPEGAVIYTFYFVDEYNNQIYFSAQQSCGAGVPFLLRTRAAEKWDLNLSNIRVVQSITNGTSGSKIGMYGTYTLTSDYKYSDTNTCYGVRSSDNKFAPLGDTLSPFRACIKTSESNSLSARSLSIVFDGGITNVADVRAQETGSIPDGKFVRGGRIVIVKNGKTYNVSGAEVK